jgi:hypothetical protein
MTDPNVSAKSPADSPHALSAAQEELAALRIFQRAVWDISHGFMTPSAEQLLGLKAETRMFSELVNFLMIQPNMSAKSVRERSRFLLRMPKMAASQPAHLMNKYLPPGDGDYAREVRELLMLLVVDAIGRLQDVRDDLHARGLRAVVGKATEDRRTSEIALWPMPTPGEKDSVS